MKDIIPESVVKKAKDFIDLYGNTIEYIGEYQGCDLYQFFFPEDSVTGFPVFYLYDTSKNSVTEVTGFDALDILDKFIQE